MMCFRCQRPLPAGALYCPWCGIELRLETTMREGDRLEDLECPVCGRGRLLSAEGEGEATPFPSDLDLQRQRFIAARDARERKRNLDDNGSRRSAQSRERILALSEEVGEENYLVLADGRVIRHVAELASCLDLLSTEVFQAHVNDLRHDFADWVERVFEEKVLADRMRGIDRARYLQLEIYRYLTGWNPGDAE